jgi:hypothetical protein
MRTSYPYSMYTWSHSVVHTVLSQHMLAMYGVIIYKALSVFFIS